MKECFMSFPVDFNRREAQFNNSMEKDNQTVLSIQSNYPPHSTGNQNSIWRNKTFSVDFRDETPMLEVWRTFRPKYKEQTDSTPDFIRV